MVTMAFGESTFTGGLLSPALVIPPAAMDGEFDASAVSGERNVRERIGQRRDRDRARIAAQRNRRGHRAIVQA